ncbi:MAG: hypothetical protein JWM57_1870 [Phycisphaerales bacterium]|nr:hypothetical protein [Phycisphaerales bacterium]
MLVGGEMTVLKCGVVSSKCNFRDAERTTSFERVQLLFRQARELIGTSDVPSHGRAHEALREARQAWTEHYNRFVEPASRRRFDR